MVHAISQHARTCSIVAQDGRHTPRENTVLFANLGKALGEKVKRCLGVKVILATRAITRGKHGGSLFLESLLGTVIQRGNARQCHDGCQTLAQGDFMATF